MIENYFYSIDSSLVQYINMNKIEWKKLGIFLCHLEFPFNIIFIISIFQIINLILILETYESNKISTYCTYFVQILKANV